MTPRPASLPPPRPAVVWCFVKPVAFAEHMSYAAAKIEPSQLGLPTYFVSHAWKSSLLFLVESAAAYLEGASPDETYLWLDVFAINQDYDKQRYPQHDGWAAMGELDDGRTLARVIDVARKTLVVLDEATLAPLRRLWCLYEIGKTPLHKLALLKHHFVTQDISGHLQGIDAEQAECFSPDDRRMIRAEIEKDHGSVARFTEALRLRFLLVPMDYHGEVRVLRRRGGHGGRRFGRLRGHVEAGPGRLACVVGGAGTGKSTLSAHMQGFVHAWHFCKRTDAARQDVAAIVRSLAYQLAMRSKVVRAELLALADDPEAARLVQQRRIELAILLHVQLTAWAAGAAGAPAVRLVVVERRAGLTL